MSDPTPLARILKRYMDEKGYILARLAAASGVDKRTIHHWLKGRARRPRTWHPLAAVADALDLSRTQTSELFEAAEYPGIDDLTRLEPTYSTLLARWSVKAPHSLPRQMTSFFGRTEEIARLVKELSERRLITLVGPAGSGKTRLALELAEALVHKFADGVYFVELAPISDPTLVISTIARVLGIPEDRLQAELSERDTLLILDNFEQVDTAAARIAALLKATRSLKVLVTSRAVLHISGEQVFPVKPLPLPERGFTLETLASNPAVALFVDSARLADIDFALVADNAPAVAEICARVDGLPLAIELAAARCRQHTPQALLDRFPSRLDLGSDGPVDAEARHRTLRATIAWSYDLLHSDERSLFARLGVFVGGCSEGASVEVCDLRDDPSLDVRSGLNALVENHVLREGTGAGGVPRYTMLETIREYALERLEGSGEMDAVRRRHAEYHLALAEEAEPELTGPRQTVWLDRLEAEHDNLRAALDWSGETGEAEIELRLGGALWWFWSVRGYLNEGRRRLGTVLARCGDVAAVLRAKALNGAGALARMQGDLSTARMLFEESLVLRRAAGDRRLIAYTLNNLGLVSCQQGDHAAAQAFHEESLAIKQNLGDEWGVAYSLSNLGIVARELGDSTTARARYTESVALWRTIGDKQGLGYALNNLGLVMQDEGDYPVARALYQESLHLLRALGHREGTATVLNNLGEVAKDEGNYDAARSLYQESLEIERDLGDRQSIAERLEGLAAVAKGIEEPLKAVRLWGVAAKLRTTIGAPLPPIETTSYERDIAATRAQLDEATFAAAWMEGQAMSLEQAIAYALDEGA